MKEKGETAASQFVPSVKLDDLYHAANASGKLRQATSNLGEGSQIQLIDPNYLKAWLENTFDKVKRLNEGWVERTFEQLREERGSWSIDGAVVDEQGEIVGSSVWSTYDVLRSNTAELRFEMSDIISSIKRNRRLVFPLSPKFESVLFWKEEDDSAVQLAIRKNTGDFAFENYNGAKGESDIRIARVRKGKLGAGQFAREGIILGKIGFWENRKLSMGNFGHGVYVQRVVFRDSSVLPDDVYISPLDPQEVKERGGRLMDDKYPQVRVIRIDPQKAQEDFIATSLAAESPIPNVPVVLSYTTPRVWLGEMPKHGFGRSGFEPPISHG